jgi:hypothetical protein
MKFSPHPCYLVPLSAKYSPQQPILKHPQPTFLPQCQRPSFTPTQNKGKIIVIEGYRPFILRMENLLYLLSIAPPRVTLY